MSDSDDSGQQRHLRSYGRRRTRKLSASRDALWQHTLPGLRPRLVDLRAGTPEAIFGQPLSDIWFEIGFGGGEHLVWQAEAYPGVGIIGCEPFVDGVVKTIAVLEQRHLRNVRLHDDDARDVLAALPDGAIGRVFILFPDPWPKLRHRKRRLVSADLIQALARVMRAGAELRLATDIGDYAAQMLRVVLDSTRFEWPVKSARDWRERCADWPPTRYEQKAVREGRRCAYLRFIRR